MANPTFYSSGFTIPSNSSIYMPLSQQNWSTSSGNRVWVNAELIPQPDHYLVITNHAVDEGQDDYFEELEWEIIHSPDCPKKADPLVLDPIRDPIHIPTNFPPRRLSYLCPMGQEVLHAGLDTLDIEWNKLEPGRYQIVQWGTRDERTGDYDGGIRLV